MSRKRLHPDERKEQILKAALKVAKSKGYNKLTREQVAAEAGISVNLINAYFGTMPKFRRHIMRAAIREEVLQVVAQGLVNKDSHAMKANPELKQKAIESFL